MKEYSKYRQGGFSLIELMIALLIGLLLIAGVLQIFSSSSVTYRINMALANLQENGRMAMTFMTRDLRLSGYNGCSAYTTNANTVRDKDKNPVDYLTLSQRINGQDNLDNGRFGTKKVIKGSDIFEVRYSGIDSCVISTHNPASASMQCEQNHEFSRGDVLVATDCKHAAVFLMSNPKATPSRTIVHNTGTGSAIGNCTKGLGLKVDCSSSNGESYAFSAGTVRKLNFARYFIAHNNAGVPSLYRQSLYNMKDAPALKATELVEGVEDMQLLYGEDTDKDGAANRYITFDQVADQDEIVSVRISLLLQTGQVNLAKQPQMLRFNGAQHQFDDGRLRKVFTSTIALRNKLL